MSNYTRSPASINPAEAEELYRRYGLGPEALGLEVRRGPARKQRPRKLPPRVAIFEAIEAITNNLRTQRRGEQSRLKRMHSYEARHRIVGTIRGLSRAVLIR